MASFDVLSAVVGILFVAGVVFAVRTYRFTRRAVHVRANVIGSLDESLDRRDVGSQSTPTMRYVVEIGGRSVRLADAFDGSLPDNLVRDDGTVAVLYDPAQPGVVRIDAVSTLYFMPLFLCTPGVLWLVMAVISSDR